MKKGFLFCLVILLCFMVTSCENFGVLGLSGTEVYLLLPDNCFLDDSFEKNSGDFVYLEEYNGFIDSEFKKRIDNNQNDENVYYCLAENYYGDFETRNNFCEEINFTLFSKGEKTISENLTLEIKIPYLKQGYNCVEFTVETKNFGIIIGIYNYYFSKYI